HKGDVLMTQKWPTYKKRFIFPEESEEMERIMDAIKAIRMRRSEMNVPPSKKTSMFIETSYTDTFTHGASFIERLAGASSVEVGDSFSIDGAVSIISQGAKILIPLDELVDKEKERARLTNELGKVEKEIAALSGKLSNKNFVDKAPAAVVDAERAKLAKAEERKGIILASLEQYK
ncbi:MAG: valine--tRNA ligase, partial [Ruminococcaceae bacterium]|nr:valine--tRNA ligase [Oscillospiraceae bacterium]